jgi:hypothetical protein
MPTFRDRDRSLLQITTERRPAREFSVIRRLQSILREPLSLQVFTKLRPDVQVSVREYFLARSGPNSALIWQSFLGGVEHPQGPKGVVLLQGHTYMWGLSQELNGHWVLHVDLPLVTGF